MGLPVMFDDRGGGPEGEAELTGDDLPVLVVLPLVLPEAPDR